MKFRMKTLNMLYKATFVIAIFAGLPHLVAQITKQDKVELASDDSGNQNKKPDQVENNKPSTVWDEVQPEKRIVGKESPLIGYWYVSYQELEMAVTYQFREEDNVVKAYSIEVYDKEGNKVNDNTLAMTVKSFNDNNGIANYFIEYKGEKSEVESKLNLTGKQLEVSYSYY